MLNRMKNHINYLKTSQNFSKILNMAQNLLKCLTWLKIPQNTQKNPKFLKILKTRKIAQNVQTTQNGFKIHKITKITQNSQN